MAQVAPEGPVYQAGTLSGNPVAVQAGLATLESGLRGDAWKRASSQTASLMEGLTAIAARKAVPVQVNGVGTMFSCFFTGMPVTNWETASESNAELFAKVFRALLPAVYTLPRPSMRLGLCQRPTIQKRLNIR